MKIKVTHEVDVPSASVSLNDRTRNPDYYRDPKYTWCRTDIGVVQFSGIANVFFGINGLDQLDVFHGVELAKEERVKLKQIASDTWFEPCRDEYRKQQENFFRQLKKDPNVTCMNMPKTTE